MIATVFALEFEGASFRAAQGRRLCVSIWTLGVTGARSAAALKRMISQARPELIVSAGFSGALQPGLALGDILIGENFSDPKIVRTLRAATDYQIGQIITAPDILETVAAKKNLGEKSGALAGDLESAHLFHVCGEAGIPMLSVRTISDVLDQDMPVPGSVLINPETGRSEPSAIFRYLFRHPAKAAQFAQLVSGARTAQQSLASALGIIIPTILMRRGAIE
jgi:adenosylhomocysteine nucleosidase